MDPSMLSPKKEDDELKDMLDRLMYNNERKRKLESDDDEEAGTSKVDSADELEKKARRDLKNRKDLEQEEREKML